MNKQLIGGRYKRVTGKDGKEYLEITNKCRCNNCMNIYAEEIIDCPICKTDEYLMQPFLTPLPSKKG